jgi:serine/threonine protein kinase
MLSLIGRRFEFLREIASGGFGRVYLAKVVHPDGFARVAAVKVMHPKWSENEEISSRMRDEARLLGWLRHKNIVEVFDLTRIEGRVAVIMEYLEAVDLKVVIQSLRETGQQIPVRAALEIAACVASALDAAYNRPPHPGEKPLRVIHRDIKPSNVMVDASGTAKVLDFGVARADFDSREAVTQAMAFGSSEYMPPERIFMEPDAETSDVYSLGVTLYEVLALQRFGKVRIQEDEAKQQFDEAWAALLGGRPDIGEPLASRLYEVLRRMMAFDAEERLKPAQAVVELRALARSFPDADLPDWAERYLPPVVQAFHQRPPSGSADSMFGRTVSEDSQGAFPLPSENHTVAGSASTFQTGNHRVVPAEGLDSSTPDIGPSRARAAMGNPVALAAALVAGGALLTAGVAAMAIVVFSGRLG